jgi:imidazolonepropionase-like amidohydrolase
MTSHRSTKQMKSHPPSALTFLLVAALTAVVTAQDPPGRGQRRRPGGGPPGGQRPEAPEPAAPEAPKPPKPKAKPIAYTNATVHVGDGKILRRATVLLDGDKIGKVGVSVEVPADATVVDCAGKHIAPGFVIVEASGIGAPSRVPDDATYRDGIDPYEPAIKRALAAGITSYLTTSARGGPSPEGTSAVIKCLPGDIEDVILKEPAVYSMSVPLGADGWRRFDESLKKVKKFRAERAEFERKRAAGDASARAPQPLDKPLQPLLSIMEKKTKLRVAAGGGLAQDMMGGGGRRRGGGSPGMTVKTIREALRLAQLLEVGILIDQAVEAWIIPDEIAATGSSCALQPRSHVAPDAGDPNPNGSSIHACKVLTEAGVPVAVLPPGGLMGGGLGLGGILGRDLNTPFLDACFAIRGGMDADEALATITLYPAMALGVHDRIGSLEPGKDADLLILDGEPLNYKSFVETAIVNGKVRYEKDKEPLYGHIRNH